MSAAPDGEKRLNSLRRARAAFASDELWIFAIAATLLGSGVRLVFVLYLDFPVNDGGLFYSMTEDIQANGYRLPATTSYNSAGIPFAYPPLPLYAAAVMNDLTGISLLTLFRALPLIASVATIPAFFLVSRNILRSPLAVQASVITFALIPRTFDWQISGGGMTRGFGLLFALLALHQATRYLLKDAQRAWVWMGLFAGLTVLCHLEMALFFACSYAVLALHAGLTRRRVLDSALAAILAAAVSAPWWLAVLSHHGIEPYRDAGTAGFSTYALAVRIFDPAVFDEPFFPIVLVLAWVGAVASFRANEKFLPLWVLVLFLVDPRKAPTHATVPVALLVGVAVAAVLVPAFRREAREGSTKANRAIVYTLTAALIFSALASPFARASPLGSVSAEGAAALREVRSTTPADATFLVITQRLWALDPVSEWFPTVTGRRSLATPQGTEWFGVTRYRDEQELHKDLQLCGDLDASCLEEWEQEAGAAFTHVFIATAKTFAIIPGPEGGCCEGLRRNLASDPRYSLVFANEGGTVFERIR